MPSVTKWNVVPPSISNGSRAWCVNTKTGVWYGGSSPHQPRHGSSPHGPRTGPNMLRPMIVAPMFVAHRLAERSSPGRAPPSSPSGHLASTLRDANDPLVELHSAFTERIGGRWSGPAT